MTSLLDADPATVRIGLVGASNDPRKYGNIILRDLVRKGFDVVPINPTEETVAGLRAYPTLEAAGPVDIANFVVPPPVATEVVGAVPADGAKVIWFQPGSFDSATVEVAKRRFDEVIAGPCIMVET